MKCRVCRGPAIIDVRRHNANYCVDHFLRMCRDQVARAIADHAMIGPDDRALVAVSGGKDSLAVWDLLVDLGVEADGLYVGLGIGEYSDRSGDHARAFAAARGLHLLEVELRDTYGFGVPDGARAARRVPCSACGTSKRHVFDRAALDGGYDVLVTGHNLDDEAAVLFGNVLHWHTDYLARQAPVLPARPGLPRKVKPLVRLAERETAAYCVIRGIDYQVEECPMAAGNRHLGYKEALDAVEERSAGAKHAFYFGFLDRAAERFRTGGAGDTDAAASGGDGAAASGDVGDDGAALGPCASCGSPTTGDVCAFCRLVARAGGRMPERTTGLVPVAAPTRRRAGEVPA